ncbi:unnamed protein product [Ilex paraguariensis]|uniref:Uncharacterized protein n=1 Tax=Ilex paraguariensis TaxID=185542 RepID=A0ABC8SVM0_9AQUA
MGIIWEGINWVCGERGGELCGGSGEATAAWEGVAAAEDKGFSKAFYFSPKSSFSLPALSSLSLSSFRVSLPSHRQQKQAVTTSCRSRFATGHESTWKEDSLEIAIL